MGLLINQEFRREALVGSSQGKKPGLFISLSADSKFQCVPQNTDFEISHVNEIKDDKIC